MLFVSSHSPTHSASLLSLYRRTVKRGSKGDAKRVILLCLLHLLLCISASCARVLGWSYVSGHIIVLHVAASASAAAAAAANVLCKGEQTLADDEAKAKASAALSYPLHSSKLMA